MGKQSTVGFEGLSGSSGACSRAARGRLVECIVPGGAQASLPALSEVPPRTGDRVCSWRRRFPLRASEPRGAKRSPPRLSTTP